jgi:hypothetical protein
VRFAVQANNRAWTLSEKPELTTDEISEMLDAAHAASHHWSRIGTPVERARADLLLGQVHARLGQGRLAMRFPTAAFDAITSRDSEPWEVAFAHAILASAAAASGNTRLHAEHYVRAKELGERLDTNDKEIFLATFNLIPAVPFGENR